MPAPLISCVIDIEEAGGLPVVPGAVSVLSLADNHYVAKGAKVPTPNGPYKGHHPTVAELWRAGDSETPGYGVYGVLAPVNIIAQLDPLSLRITFTELAADPRAALFVADGVDGSPRISSARGLSEERPVARLAEEP